MEYFDSKKHSKTLENAILGRKIALIGSKLLAFQIGNDPVPLKYVGIKAKLCEKLGIPFEHFVISSAVSDEEIIEIAHLKFNEPSIGGVIVQLPIRQSLNPIILDLIPLNKDVDLLSSINRIQSFEGRISLKAPIFRACEYFIDSINKPIEDLSVLVIGDGYLVGNVVYSSLRNRVRQIDLTNNYATGTKINYDLVILGAGIPNLVKGDDINPGASVIDFGTSESNGVLVGDLDLSSNLDHLNVVSKSPGGMGPIVTRFLIINFLDLLGV